MSESEHHLHRSDEEWRAIIRGWHDRMLRSDMVKVGIRQHQITREYLDPELARIIDEMEKTVE